MELVREKKAEEEKLLEKLMEPFSTRMEIEIATVRFQN